MLFFHIYFKNKTFPDIKSFQKKFYVYYVGTNRPEIKPMGHNVVNLKNV